MSTLQREAVYLWYYFDIQVRQIFWYWLLGMVIGSLVSVFAKERIHRPFVGMSRTRLGVVGVVPAAVLGILSPLCMYGTIPIAASFAEKGMRQDWLASFMMASVLLNPQLIIYSTALGSTVLSVRIASCFLCGITAGLVIHFAYHDTAFFSFSGLPHRRTETRPSSPSSAFLRTCGGTSGPQAVIFCSASCCRCCFSAMCLLMHSLACLVRAAAVSVC